MKRYIKSALLIVSALLLGNPGVFAQNVKQLNIQQVTPPASLRSIQLQPGAAKHLPILFVVATKTRLFLALAGDIHLTDQQKTQLEEIHRALQERVSEVKTNYDKQNEGLQDILSKDNIELQQMRDNLRAAEELKAEMQYCLFESLVKAANVLTPEQRLKIVASVENQLPAGEQETEKFQ